MIDDADDTLRLHSYRCRLHGGEKENLSLNVEEKEQVPLLTHRLTSATVRADSMRI